MNSRLILFVSCLAAVTLTASVLDAAPRGQGKHGRHGGYHGKHFSSITPRGGHGRHGGHFGSISARGGGPKFSRSGPTFNRATSGTYRNWSGNKWGGGHWDSYPSWGWGIPYALNYGYASYGYYPSYTYGFGYPYSWGWYRSWNWGYPYAYLSYSFYPYS